MRMNDKVFEIYPDNVAAEQIIHTKHVKALTPEGFREACMLDIDTDFHEKMERGKIMVAGRNFGCNSSREWAPASLKYSDVKLIIAESFSRIFFSSAINIGLLILECPGITEFCDPGDELEVDFSTGVVENKTKGAKISGMVLPEFLLDIMTAGGLMNKLEAEMEEKCHEGS